MMMIGSGMPSSQRSMPLPINVFLVGASGDVRKIRVPGLCSLVGRPHPHIAPTIA